MFFSRISLILLVFAFFIALFGVSAVLGSRASYDPALSQEALTAILLSIIVYFAIAYGARHIAIAWLIGGVSVLLGAGFAIYFIGQFAYQNYPETPAFIQRIGNITTILPKLGDLYVHPNAAATFLETLLPVSVALCIGSRRWFLRIFWLMCSLLYLYAIFLTYSRGSWVALLVVGMISLYLLLVLRFFPERKLLVTAAASVIAILGILLFFILSSRFPALANVLGTAESRLTLYQNSLYLASDYPYTGIGLGETFGMVYSRYALLIYVPFLTYSHNLPLAVWLGQGLPGLISFVGLLICFYAFAIRVIQFGHPHGVINLLFYGALMGATATLLHGLTDARQYTESPWIMPSLFVAFGLTVATGSNANSSLHDKGMVEARSWIVPMGLFWGFVLLLVGVIFTTGQTMQAAWEANLGALLETRSDRTIMPALADAERAEMIAQAEQHYRAALAIDSSLPSANRRLGNLLVAQEDFADAIGFLDRAVIAEPDNAAAKKGLGLAYTWLGRTDDAAHQFSALADPVAMQEELFAWAQFREDSAQPLLSAYALETALLMGSVNASPNLDVWVLVGDRYREAGNSVRARNWYARVLEQDASNERAKAGLDSITP